MCRSFALVVYYDVFFCFFFKQKTAYEMRISDWSSDVCSSDLIPVSQTAPGTDVDTLLNAAEPTIEQTDVASINGVLAGADRTLAGRGQQVRDVFTDLADLASTFADREVELARRSEEHTSELQ